MKKILFVLLVWTSVVPALAEKWPAPVGAINDFAHVLSADQAQELENYLDDFQQKTGSAIVVATFPSVEGGDVDQAAVDLFKDWGVGQKGKDNGILILASIQDRRIRIEVGYGLEGVVTDGDAGDILRQQVYPYFKQKQYGEGLANACQALAQLIQQGGTAQDQGGSTGSASLWEIIKIVIIIVAVLIFLYIRIRFGGWWGGGFYGGGGWGGGGGWSGGGGGGFGGFGGGGSGGGGASGGW